MKENLSEADILKLIRQEFVFPEDKTLVLGAGDDCAMLQLQQSRLLITTDEQIEGTHFLAGSKARDIACKLMRVNISDLAAMGYVRPISCLIGAALAPGFSPEFLQEFISALKEEALKFHISIAGGNLAAARENHFYMTLFGIAELQPLLRSGSAAGDLLAIIGKLGEAKAAVEILSKHNFAEQEEYAELIESFWRPLPQLLAGKVLAKQKIAAALLDNSDGLFKSAGILAKEAGLKAIINASALPISKPLALWCKHNGKLPSGYAISGGEDYGLVFSLRPEKAPSLAKWLPSAKIIGRFEHGKGVEIENFDGKIENFEHF